MTPRDGVLRVASRVTCALAFLVVQKIGQEVVRRDFLLQEVDDGVFGSGAEPVLLVKVDPAGEEALRFGRGRLRSVGQRQPVSASFLPGGKCAEEHAQQQQPEQTAPLAPKIVGKTSQEGLTAQSTRKKDFVGRGRRGGAPLQRATSCSAAPKRARIARNTKRIDRKTIAMKIAARMPAA